MSFIECQWDIPVANQSQPINEHLAKASKLVPDAIKFLHIG